MSPKLPNNLTIKRYNFKHIDSEFALKPEKAAKNPVSSSIHD